MKTIIFGGSFDPIHLGHIKMALKAKEFLNADKVVFMLAKAPRWKVTKEESFHRLEMLKIALKDYSWAAIDLTEYNSEEEINYTFNTINLVKDKYDGEIYFLFGGDQLNKLDKWYRIDELSKLVNLVAITRPDYVIDDENVNRYQVTLIKENVSEMSSTKLRNLHSLECPFEVLKYIIENNLYFVPKLKEYISNKRFNHSYEVAKLAYQIAFNNSLNPFSAFLGGLLHDIGREIEKEKQIAYMKEFYPEYEGKIPLGLYHQFVSEDICRNVFHIENEDVLRSIKYHGTGNREMTDYAKIVYSSDKIEPTRGYDSSDMIKTCIKDFNQGFIYVLKENIKFLASTGKSYDNPLTNACINYYLKEGN